MLSKLWRRGSDRRDRSPHSGRTILALECLESRDLLTTFSPLFLLDAPAGASAPLATAGPTGYSPAQVSQAYGFNQIYFNNGAIQGNGSGQTIAIVDAFDDPNIASDLHQFDLAFGLPDPVFAKVNQNGGGNLPPANASWASEIALDVEWAHAMAPGAKILLVEANSTNDSDLFAAVRYAAQQPGVSVVSMSWGGAEFAGETSSDGTFTTPAGHPGVSFLAATGDNGAPGFYPAFSPNVVAVGGTNLYLNASGYGSESAWSFSGGGISSQEAKPFYQGGVVPNVGNRVGPDVSYDADPNTGLSVYDSYANPATTPWIQMGGTSAGTPQWAALVAIADQGRALNGLGSLDGPSQLLPALYQLPSTDFHDVASGAINGNPGYPAVAGFDLATGRGSPYANRVVASLSEQPLLIFAPFSNGPNADTNASALPPSPFEVMARDALFVLRGFLAGDSSLVLWGLQDAQNTMLRNPLSAFPLQQAFFSDLLADVQALR